jgi:hypothetical protein
MVRDALELLANGYPLDDIPRMWCSGKITREAVVEAIRLATATCRRCTLPLLPLSFITDTRSIHSRNP